MRISNEFARHGTRTLHIAPQALNLNLWVRRMIENIVQRNNAAGTTERRVSRIIRTHLGIKMPRVNPHPIKLAELGDPDLRGLIQRITNNDLQLRARVLPLLKELTIIDARLVRIDRDDEAWRVLRQPVKERSAMERADLKDAPRRFLYVQIEECLKLPFALQDRDGCRRPILSVAV